MDDEMKTRYGVSIPKPCPMKWEELVGDKKKRYCSSCQLHVHNLSEMSSRERTRFLDASQERSCVAFQTAPRRPMAWRLGRFGVILASLSALFLPGCANREMSMGVPCPPKTEHQPSETGVDGKREVMVVVGELQRPLWQRILWPFN